MKRFACFALAVVMAFGLGSALAEASAPQKITIISTSDTADMLDYVAQKYQEQYNVAVEIITQSYDNTHQKITTSVAGRSDADIVYLDVIWPAEFASLGIVIPLDSYISEETKSTIIDASMNQMRYGGSIYGLPYGNNGMWMYYNKQMLADGGFENPPKTWDELKSMSQTLMDMGLCKYGISLAGKQAEGLVCYQTVLMNAFGGDWINENGAFGFAEESGVQALSFMADAIKDGWADPASITYGDRETLDPFLAGDTAFSMNWSFAWRLANDPAQSKIVGNVGICLIPGTDKAVSASVTGGGGMGILSSSDAPEYAYRFIEMLVSEDVQKWTLTNKNSLPVLASLYQDAELQQAYPQLPLMFPQYEYASTRPAIPKYSEWSNKMQVAISSVLVGQADAATALNKALEDVKDYLK